MPGYRRGSGGPDRSRPNDCLPIPAARTLADRLPVVRPTAGHYPIRALAADGTQAPGWVPPAARGPDVFNDGYRLGRGPVQYLGCFDTMPDLTHYDDAMAANLRPTDAPGGATLRFHMPRPLRVLDDPDGAYRVSSVAPAMRYHAGLALYVAGVDVLPPGWRDAITYPGLPAGVIGDGPYIADDNDSEWAQGLQQPFNNDPGGSPVQETFGPGGLADGVRYLAHHVARPMLDLFGYMGGPGAEADLGELAGGTRYVAAWLRLWWTREDGVDPFVDVDHDIAWTVHPGRAINPGHRHVWHNTIPVQGHGLDPGQYEDEIRLNGASYGLASPIAGNWRAVITSNAPAAGAQMLYVGLELRNGGTLERDWTAVAWNEHGVASQLAPSTRHGGAAVILAGYDETAGNVNGLVSVSVTP